MHKRMITACSMILAASVGATRADDKDAKGPIDSLQDLRDTAKMVFKMADANNDGLISQKEAVDAGNLVVGGAFFRADADGDGKVTKEEADAARENMLNQRPILRFVFQRADAETNAQGTKPQVEQAKQDVMNVVDANHDGAIEASELRQAVQTGVQSLYLTADRNGDGQLDPAELNFATVELGRAGLQAAFQTADLDKNGAVSRDEFDKAILNPANVVFRVMDANNDGQLSREELQSGARILLSEIRKLEIPEPANTLPKQVEHAIDNVPASAPAAIRVAPTPAAAQPR